MVRLKRLAALLTAATMSVATISIAAAADIHRGGQMTFAYPSGPTSLDPHNSSQIVEVDLAFHVFETLVAMGEGYSAVPSLASSIEVSDDARTYTFRLREGVKFHNGKIMTSEDVLASYERYRAVGGSAAILADVESFEAPDPHTFVINLKTPNGLFLDVIKTARHAIAILPSEERDKPAREVNPIGTGPFTYGEWVRDSHIVLERFEDYSTNEAAEGIDGYAGRKEVYIDSVRYQFIPEISSRMASVQAGDSDVAKDIPPDIANRARSDESLEVYDLFPFGSAVVPIHTKNAPTDNLLVRRAIQAVVNAEDIMAGTGLPHQLNPALLYPSSEYYVGDQVSRYYSMNNIELAQSLLKEAGYNGEQIKLQATGSQPRHRDTLLILAEYMKMAGMNAVVEMVDDATSISNLNTGEGGWNATSVMFSSHPLIGPSAFQTAIFDQPQIDGDEVLEDAFARLYVNVDLEARQAAWLDIETRVFDQVYMIKIGDYGSAMISNDRVHDLVPWYTTRFWNVWLDEE